MTKIGKFARDDRMADGHLNYCGPCRRSRTTWSEASRGKRVRGDRFVSLGQKAIKRATPEPRKSVCEAIEYIRQTCRDKGYITTAELRGVKVFVRRDAVAWLTYNDTLYEDDTHLKPEWYSFLWADNPKIVDKVAGIV